MHPVIVDKRASNVTGLNDAYRWDGCVDGGEWESGVRCEIKIEIRWRVNEAECWYLQSTMNKCSSTWKMNARHYWVAKREAANKPIKTKHDTSSDVNPVHHPCVSCVYWSELSPGDDCWRVSIQWTLLFVLMHWILRGKQKKAPPDDNFDAQLPTNISGSLSTLGIPWAMRINTCSFEGLNFSLGFFCFMHLRNTMGHPNFL